MWLLKYFQVKMVDLLWSRFDGNFRHFVLLLEFKNNGISSIEIKLIRKALNRTVHDNSRRVFQ